MASEIIDGLRIDYSLYGEEGAPAIALTPGGRFSKETPGLPELAAALAGGGRRVLLWDRPNSGASDMCFAGESESLVHARSLIGLIARLGLGRTALAAGSAGSRVSLIAAAQDPAAVSHLILWWVSGGIVGNMFLAAYYYYNSAVAAAQGGMAAVAELPEWAEPLARNPRNRAILLAQDPVAFVDLMQRWSAAFVPRAETPVSGLGPADFARLTMPALLLRNGHSDVSHTRATTDALHRLLPDAALRDPPWGDDEWNGRLLAFGRGEAPGLFVNWPVLAPLILDFTGGLART